MLKSVTQNEIFRIFEILDRHEISREAVIIPLKPAETGRVRRLSSGKFEILVEGTRPLDDWLPELEAELLALHRS